MSSHFDRFNARLQGLKPCKQKVPARREREDMDVIQLRATAAHARGHEVELSEYTKARLRLEGYGT